MRAVQRRPMGSGWSASGRERRGGAGGGGVGAHPTR